MTTDYTLVIINNRHNFNILPVRFKSIFKTHIPNNRWQKKYFPLFNIVKADVLISE